MRRWRTLRRRFAATLIAICSALGIQAQAAQRLTLDDAIARVAQMHPEIRWVEARTVVLAAERERAEQRPPWIAGAEVENAFGTGHARGESTNPLLSNSHEPTTLNRFSTTTEGQGLAPPALVCRR